MTYVKITDKNGKPIDESNPLPVTGGGTGGSLEVDIVANSAGLATAQGQQDIVDAINNLSDASSEIYTDSVTIDDTGVQLPDLPIGEVIIQNDQDSGQDIYIGNDTDQELRLKAGEWVSVRITNLNLIYAKTSTGTATLRYFARSAAGIPGGGSSPVPVELTGSLMQQYGATVAQRPAANSVPVGAYYMAVQTQEIWQSDGTNWVVIRGA